MMTIQEQKEQRAEWIKTIKPGDEVCVTNIFKPLLSFDPDSQICEFDKVRGILEDGTIIVGNIVYKADGTPEDDDVDTELFQVTEEVLEARWRLRFYNDVKAIDWSRLSTDGIGKIIDVINEEIKKIEEEEKRKKAEEAAQKAKVESEAVVIDSAKSHEPLISSYVQPTDIDSLAAAVAEKLKDTQNDEGGNDDGAES